MLDRFMGVSDRKYPDLGLSWLSYGIASRCNRSSALVDRSSVMMRSPSGTQINVMVDESDMRKHDAKNAVDHLSGFNVCGRYLVVLFYQQTKMQKRLDTEREMKELAEMRARLGIDSGDAGADLSGR